MPSNLKKHLPNAHFGKVGGKPVDWTKFTDDDPDDEELERTPKDVRRMLGFDPKKKTKTVVKKGKS
jgi:hypothetical protein